MTRNFEPMKIAETDTLGTIKRKHAGEVQYLQKRIGRWKYAAYSGWGLVFGFVLREIAKSAGWL